VFLVNRTGPQLRFFHNTSRGAAPGCNVVLREKSGNTAALGARLGGLAIKAGEGFLSQLPAQQHLAAPGGEIQIKWPNGKTQAVIGLPAGKQIFIMEGDSDLKIAVPQPFVGKAGTLADGGPKAAGGTTFPVPWPMAPIPLEQGKACLTVSQTTLVMLHDGSCEDCRLAVPQWQELAVALTERKIAVVVLYRGTAPRELPSGWKAHGLDDISVAYLLDWQQQAFGIQQPLPNLCHWLLSAEGCVLGLYRGPLEVAKLSSPAFSSGHWVRAPQIPDPLRPFSFLVPQGCWAAAVGYLQQHGEVLRKHPRFLNMAASLAERLQQAKETSLAIAAYESALRAQPHPALLNNLASLRLATDPRKALQEATEATRLSGDKDPAILETLAQAALLTGDLVLCEKTLTTALALSNDPDLQSRLLTLRKTLTERMKYGN
jgi:hypothetical protein